MHNLINWNELSNVLLKESKRKTPLRKGKIPLKHKNRVDQLEKYIDKWLKREKLMTREEANSLLKDDIGEIKAKIDDLYEIL